MCEFFARLAEQYVSGRGGEGGGGQALVFRTFSWPIGSTDPRSLVCTACRYGDCI